jgi:hypothetical protein
VSCWEYCTGLEIALCQFENKTNETKKKKVFTQF